MGLSNVQTNWTTPDSRIIGLKMTPGPNKLFSKILHLHNYTMWRQKRLRWICGKLFKLLTKIKRMLLSTTCKDYIIGKVHDVSKDIIIINMGERHINVMFSDVRSHFSPGDYILVKAGENTGKVGTVTKVE